MTERRGAWPIKRFDGIDDSRDKGDAVVPPIIHPYRSVVETGGVKVSDEYDGEDGRDSITNIA